MWVVCDFLLLCIVSHRRAVNGNRVILKYTEICVRNLIAENFVFMGNFSVAPKWKISSSRRRENPKLIFCILMIEIYLVKKYSFAYFNDV